MVVGRAADGSRPRFADNIMHKVIGEVTANLIRPKRKLQVN